MISCEDVAAPTSLYCTDIFGIIGGDWVDMIADQFGVNGNMSVDPLFCDTTNADFSLQDNSPCAPANNSCETLIGAIDVGCTCCYARGKVDDINGIGGPIDAADLSYLVDHLFKGGNAPPCFEQGNVDGIIGGGGAVDVSDLSYLVDYLFKGGSTPPPCP